MGTRTLATRWSLVLTAIAAGLLPTQPVDAQEAATSPQPVSTPPVTGVPAARSGDASMSEKEKALLQKIKALKAPRWRTYGACRYDWSTWRLASDGVRTTTVQCGQVETMESVAVFCDTFKVSYRVGEGPWSTWRLPFSTEESKTRGGEDLMVAALCANAQPVPKAAPVKPASEPAGQSARPVKGAPGEPAPRKP